MSGIAALYNLDGRPVEPALLRRMTDVIAHRGPDGAGMLTDGAVGLGHRMLRTTPESLGERQPLTDETGDLAITFDGRIDNRDELIAGLKAAGARLEAGTDAELVLRAYQLWSEQSPRRMLGDFAFVIWDKRQRRLFCARDPLGVKPFCYHRDERTFRCGSELHQLLQDPAVRREPNEGMVGEYLTGTISSLEETLYQGVFRLPPAHLLVVEPERIRIEHYWNMEPVAELSYRTDEEYAEHFRELFREAVKCRLRCCGPVGADLSGGLDSSSVVGMAQSLIRAGECTVDGFETFSMVYPGLGCDESAYSDAVVRMWKLKANRLSFRAPEASCFADSARRYLDFPGYPNGEHTRPIRELARAKGIRVNLTGIGGDERLGRSLLHYADLVRGLRIPSLVGAAAYEASRLGIRAGLRTVLAWGLAPFLPDVVLRAIKIARGGERKFLPWIDARLARRVGLLDRFQTNARIPKFPNFAQRGNWAAVNDGHTVYVTEADERWVSGFGTEERHPFLDRRIVEFVVALPEAQRWRPGQNKFVLRQAMRDLLPETVRWRSSKAEFSQVFAATFKVLGGETLFDSPGIESVGWVDVARVRKMNREMIESACTSEKKGYISHIRPLWMVFGIELWFRTVLLGELAEGAIRATQSTMQCR